MISPRLFILGVLTSSCLACASVPAPTVPDDILQACNAFGATTIGKELSADLMAAATQRGFTFRIFHKGVMAPATMDFRPDRINFTLDNRAIAKASCG